jgi:hypothetical protein
MTLFASVKEVMAVTGKSRFVVTNKILNPGLADGSATVAEVRRSGQRGRPEHVYQFSRAEDLIRILRRMGG